MNHVFPSKTTAHILTLSGGANRTLLVSPSETFGKALSRAGIKEDDVKAIELVNSPLSYEPDWSVASR